MSDPKTSPGGRWVQCEGGYIDSRDWRTEMLTRSGGKVVMYETGGEGELLASFPGTMSEVLALLDPGPTTPPLDAADVDTLVELLLGIHRDGVSQPAGHIRRADYLDIANRLRGWS